MKNILSKVLSLLIIFVVFGCSTDSNVGSSNDNYDSTNNPKIEVVDRDGNVIYKTIYDGEGRVLEKNYYEKDRVILSEKSFIYNKDGRINSYSLVKKGVAYSVYYDYNRSGNVISKKIHNNDRGMIVENQTIMEYDGDSQKILRSIENNVDGETINTEYIYDNENILKQIKKIYPDGNVVSYNYDYGDYNNAFYK